MNRSTSLCNEYPPSEPRKRPLMNTRLITALLLLGAPSTAAASPLSLSATPTTVAPGGSIVVKYRVKHRPATLVLRLDGKKLHATRVRKARGRTTVKLPRGVAAGPHRLTACVKRACRSVRLKVARSGPGSPAPSPAPAPAPPEQP